VKFRKAKALWAFHRAGQPVRSFHTHAQHPHPPIHQFTNSRIYYDLRPDRIPPWEISQSEKPFGHFPGQVNLSGLSTPTLNTQNSLIHQFTNSRIYYDLRPDRIPPCEISQSEKPFGHFPGQVNMSGLFTPTHNTQTHQFTNLLIHKFTISHFHTLNSHTTLQPVTCNLQPFFLFLPKQQDFLHPMLGCILFKFVFIKYHVPYLTVYQLLHTLHQT
jgi:hypothetical protein